MVTSAVRQRGRYSKNGCRQCKTRRIKCDEGKPDCWQCSRLKKPCLYLRKDREGEPDGSGSHSVQKQRKANERASLERLTYAIWENREKVGRQEIGREQEIVKTTPNRGDSEISTSSESSRESSHQPQAPVASTSLVEIVRGDAGTGIQDLSSNEGQSIANEAITTLVFPERHQRRDQRCAEPINHYDLNLLALDLDSIVNNMMDVDQSGTINEYSRMGNEILEESEEGSNPGDIQPTSRTYDGRDGDNYFPRNLPFDFIPFTRNNEKLYFEEFYNNLSTIIQPFPSYDPIHGYYCTTRDIFLQVASKEPFVLSAILSQGAKMSYEKHGLKEDEEASYKYLIKCLRLFEPALLHSREHSDLVSHKIEAVLLTILILASANASMLNSDWRSHLRGAKELLLKYSANSNDSLFDMSRVMVFCKHWFISFEILAGLSSSRGGTLRKDTEMDLILNASEHEMQILEKMGIVRPDGFNLLVGIHHSSLTPIKGLIKLLNRSRSENDACNTFDVIELLSQFHEQLKIKFVFREGTKNVDDFLGTELPNGSLLEYVNLLNGKLVISWMDISHQSYVLASMIILLRNGLQFTPSNPHVQCLNKKLLNLVSFITDCQELSSNSKNSMLLIQWPILIAGLNCIGDADRLIAMKFFRSLANIGTTNSTYALRKFNKVWKQPNTEASDCLDSSDVDVMTY
ncbi:CIC11C00000002325 [Sungouiella intermedia]|uniref:CIC11C00000002325 n=1 Tax=Sungouiella intermedia TaxID=45354 RepID=A0A1L0BNK2_9ASCO|nr:CIC11C00000002325 [[Candida] intermedia]